VPHPNHRRTYPKPCSQQPITLWYPNNAPTLPILPPPLLLLLLLLLLLPLLLLLLLPPLPPPPLRLRFRPLLPLLVRQKGSLGAGTLVTPWGLSVPPQWSPTEGVRVRYCSKIGERNAQSAEQPSHLQVKILLLY
jgi:hypothetical protein